MVIVIDGYNVLKQVFSAGTTTHTVRTRFINQLQQYAVRKNHSILLVFDAGPAFKPTKECYGAVTVVYAGTAQTADEYIKMCLEDMANQELLLVSSDREITRHAARLGIESIDAPDFYYFLTRPYEVEQTKNRSGAPVVVKTIDGKSSDIDQLMELASRGVPYKEEDNSRRPGMNKSSAVTISKNERKRERLFKKL